MNTLHRRILQREYDAQRRAEQRARAWYKGAQWRRLRARQLQRHSLCERCLQQGHITPATVVHHRIPHKNRIWLLFFDPNNLASSCVAMPRHHRARHRGTRIRSSVASNGEPIDPPIPGTNRKIKILFKFECSHFVSPFIGLFGRGGPRKTNIGTPPGPARGNAAELGFLRLVARATRITGRAGPRAGRRKTGPACVRDEKARPELRAVRRKVGDATACAEV